MSHARIRTVGMSGRASAGAHLRRCVAALVLVVAIVRGTGVAWAATPIRVAVLPFAPATGEPESRATGALLADAAMAKLQAEARVTLVDREQIRHVVRELSLESLGVGDSTAAVKIGHVVSADLVVTGYLQRHGKD